MWLDALALRRREGGRTVHVAALVAVGVNADGKREILGLERLTSPRTCSRSSMIRRAVVGVKMTAANSPFTKT